MKIGFFEDKPGEKSMGRLLSFICVAGAIVIAIVQEAITGDMNETVVIGLATIGITGKAYTKWKELQHRKNDEKTSGS